MSKDITRRDFFQYAGLLGFAALGGSTLFSSCSGKKQEQSQEMQSSPKQEAAPADTGSGMQEDSTMAASDPCNDLSGVPEQDIKTRKSLDYVGKSPYPDKHCSNCALFIAPQEGQTCGGCQLFKGPINPDGHCKSWVEKT